MAKKTAKKKVAKKKAKKKAKKNTREHDKVVLEAGEFLSSKNGYNVYADRRHIRSDKKWEGNGFEQTDELTPPDLLLSAFVPAKAIFSPKWVSLDPNWKTPDLAVTWEGHTYVLDVLGKKSTITMMARKFETFIANYEKHNIVGMAFIGIPSEDADKEKEFKKEEFERLQETFNLLFEGSSHDKYPEWFWDVKSLFSHKSCQDIYGEIRWDNVLVITYGEANWKETLWQHVDDALNAKKSTCEKTDLTI